MDLFIPREGAVQVHADQRTGGLQMKLTLEQLDSRITNLEHEIASAHEKNLRLTCAIQVKSEKLKRLRRIRFNTVSRADPIAHDKQ
jgi:hypothetical protein